MASSSYHLTNHKLSNNDNGATTAPPPTPSCTTSNSETAVNDLSSLFLRLPPLLSLPQRNFSDAVAPMASLPMVSLSPGEDKADLISAATDFGYFQLTNDETNSVVIPPGLAEAAESESFSLFKFNDEENESSFPKNWPLGYDADGQTQAFCLDVDCSTKSSELKLNSLREFTRILEKVGLKTVEMLTSALGFGCDATRFTTLMWLYKGVCDDEPETTNGFYPFVVCVQYQIREEKFCLLTDETEWVTVLPRVDSVLVTFGDIAQVWSNGEIKRVKYRPVWCSGINGCPKKIVTMTLMLTLPKDTMVSPLKGMVGDADKEEEYAEEEVEDGGAGTGSDEKRAFESFSFEEYAWEVYHDRFFLMDLLDKYRIKSEKD